jgi:hypothetical protein
MKTPTEALANHLQMDYSELKDYRYHYGHTSRPVYALEDSYYCITKGSQKAATHRSGMEWEWVEVKDRFINEHGYKIWKHKN